MHQLIASRMRAYRITSRELAAEMGVSHGTVWRFLAGRRKREGDPFCRVLEQALLTLEQRRRAEIAGA